MNHCTRRKNKDGSFLFNFNAMSATMVRFYLTIFFTISEFVRKRKTLDAKAVTGNPMNRGQFRTPTLRNVELRAPYMHNGRFQTLEEVVEFYNRGGDFDAPNIDHGNIRPLNLNAQEKAALVTFMKRPLTDPRIVNGLPPFNSPTLYTKSNRVPVISGTGRAGSGGTTPKVIANEPPLVGNPSFTVGVSAAFGNAQAVLVIDSSDPGVGVDNSGNRFIYSARK